MKESYDFFVGGGFGGYCFYVFYNIYFYVEIRLRYFLKRGRVKND